MATFTRQMVLDIQNSLPGASLIFKPNDNAHSPERALLLGFSNYQLSDKITVVLMAGTNPAAIVCCADPICLPADSSKLFKGTRFRGIDFGGVDTSQVTSMRGMFYECEVPEIDLSSFDTHSVTNMNAMFDSCTAESLDLQSFDTRKVTDMSYMFCNCAASEIVVTNALFDTSQAQYQHNMMDGCSAVIRRQ